MHWHIPPKHSKHHDSIKQADARLNLWVGSVRSGKTITSLFTLINWIIKEAPPGAIVITGNTSDTTNRNVLLPLMEYLGGEPFCDFSIGRRTGTLFNRTVHIVSGNDESSYKRLQGATFAGAYCDEITTYPKSFWLMLLSRLSLKGSRLFGTTNPDVPTHWLKTDFMDNPEISNKRVFQFSLYDNPFLDLEYIHSLETEYSGVWKKRYIDGLWVAGSGAIYDCFGEGNIIANSKQYLNRCQRVWSGCDYGTVNALAFGIYGLDYDGVTIYKFAEYYYDSKVAGVQKSDSEYVLDIQSFLATHLGGRPLTGLYVDPSAASFIVSLRKAGLPVIAANNSVLEGIQHVYGLLSRRHYLIDATCENTIKQYYSYSWDSKASARGKEQPIKVEDHALDGDRYALFSTRSSSTLPTEGIVTLPMQGLGGGIKTRRR